jgi:hypothetical protein
MATNSNCVLGALCFAAVVALAMSLQTPSTSFLESQVKAKDQQLAAYLTQAQNDALAAKKMELQALETARVAEKALADAKKKLSECR